MFSINYYRISQNRHISQEFYLLLAADKELKKLFPDVPVVDFVMVRAL